MLKLFKYDFRAISRRLIPLYLVGIVIGVINVICSSILSNMLSGDYTSKAQEVTFMILTILKGLLSFSFFILSSYISILTIFILISNFHSSVYGNEGYLINSLPIESKKLILAKYFNFLFWTFVSGIFYTIFYVAGLFSNVNKYERKELFDHFNEVKVELFKRMASYPHMSKIIALIIIAIICYILYILLYSWYYMLSVTFANLIKLNKIVVGLITFVICNIVVMIISVTLMISGIVSLSKIEGSESSEIQVFNILSTHGITLMIALILLNVGSFFLINYIHSKKIDLE